MKILLYLILKKLSKEAILFVENLLLLRYFRKPKQSIKLKQYKSDYYLTIIEAVKSNNVKKTNI